MKLDYKRTILVGFAFFLISAFWQAYDAIVPLILNHHFGLPDTASGAIMSLDNIFAVFLLPLFGSLSDKVNTRLGRRTPFILFGTIAAVVSFFVLTFVDNLQLSLLPTGEFATLLEGAVTDAAREEAFSKIAEQSLAQTLANPWPLIGFIGLLLVVLLSMATFRSPAVALMPDVTIKPLRSKGNAIINLMGTAGGIVVLVFGMLFGTSNNQYMQYTGYVLAVVGIMSLALVVFMLTVKEKQWAGEMEAETKRLGLDGVAESESGEKRGLSKDEMKSLLLILASVALWYIGYNSITSKYTVYAGEILRVDFNFTLIIAQAAAVIAYIPVGIIASKLGRRKTILAGIVMLATAFFIGNFITSDSGWVQYPIFILAGIGWATINVNSFPMVVELAKCGDVGKYTGYYYTASMSAQIVAPILSGILYDLIGMRYVFFAFGTLFVVLSFVTMFFVRHGDARPEKEVAIAEAFGGDD